MMGVRLRFSQLNGRHIIFLIIITGFLFLMWDVEITETLPEKKDYSSNKAFHRFSVNSSQIQLDHFTSPVLNRHAKPKQFASATFNEPSRPDYTNLPLSDRRPFFEFRPYNATSTEEIVPLVTVISPFYNIEPAVYMDCLRGVLHQSFSNWEMVIVDDASTNAESIALLNSLEKLNGRFSTGNSFKLHRLKTNSGPSHARNVAVSMARGNYIVFWDGDDLFEPTYFEKTFWFLETHADVSIVGCHFITFGGKPGYWASGYDAKDMSLTDNQLLTSSVMRTAAFRGTGGYNEKIKDGGEDWLMWLNLAEEGHRGYTIPEPLFWYRSRTYNKWKGLEPKALEEFRASLPDRFPRIYQHGFPVFEYSINEDFGQPYNEQNYPQHIPGIIPLPKSQHPRILFIQPYLEMGGLDAFNVHLIEVLLGAGWEVTVATTMGLESPWFSEYARFTEDIHILPRYVDSPHQLPYLCHLLHSRHIDIVLITNSMMGYLFTEYSHKYCPSDAVFMDAVHSLAPQDFLGGGYPAMSTAFQPYLHRTISVTKQLKEWMGYRGKTLNDVGVFYIGANCTELSLEGVDVNEIKRQLNLPQDRLIILWVGRFSPEKGPRYMVRAIAELSRSTRNFHVVAIGSGQELAPAQEMAKKFKLKDLITFTGALPSSQVKLYMAAGDILLSSSEIEGAPLVIYEALAMQMGVWIKLPIHLANLVETLIKEGFWYHHAEPKYLMLVHWIADSANTIPANATHRVGVGALVVNEKREVLVVQEKTGHFRGTGSWKFPTGVADQGEEIWEAAVREVKEEAGVDSEFVEVLAFRQSHASFFEKSDLFFVCLLRPVSSDIKIQEVEIEAGKWMPFDEYAAQPFMEKYELLRQINDIYLAKIDGHYSGFTPVSTKSNFSNQKNSYLYLNVGGLKRSNSL